MDLMIRELFLMPKCAMSIKWLKIEVMYRELGVSVRTKKGIQSISSEIC